MSSRIGKAGSKNAPWTPQRVRDRIRAGRLVERLQAFALGVNDPSTRQAVTMSSEQVRAAEIVLRKVVPDLKHVEHTGELRRGVDSSMEATNRWLLETLNPRTEEELNRERAKHPSKH